MTDSAIDPVAPPAQSASPLEWCEASRPYHLTIKDILELPVGKKIYIFTLDRNYMDLSCDLIYNPINKPILPSQFFKRGYFWTFVKKEPGIQGEFIWIRDESGRHGEFDIEYQPGEWYCLKDDRLPAKDWQGIFDFKDKGGKHYADFPLETRLGWRGPMLLVEDMDKCPKVIWEGTYF